MEFKKNLDTAAALKLIGLLDEQAMAGQQWDGIEYVLTDGSTQHVSDYNYGGRDRPRPNEFVAATAVAKGSLFEVVQDGPEWIVKFKGMRGSLFTHWGQEVIELLQAQPGEVYDYQTSILGMQPWEGLWDWARRVGIISDTEQLHPYDPVHSNEAEEFNKLFYQALMANKKRHRGQINVRVAKADRNDILGMLHRRNVA